MNWLPVLPESSAGPSYSCRFLKALGGDHVGSGYLNLHDNLKLHSPIVLSLCHFSEINILN